MDDLNKNQLVLLVLLVSFVTSIATGIITTALLQQAPVEVTRTINQVVEKTIEKVTPGNPTPSKPTEVTTVVVKEEDQILGTINKNVKSIVRIKVKDAVLGTVGFYGIGFIVDKNGLIGTDRKALSVNDAYTATLSDGSEYPVVPVGADKKTDFLLFKIQSAKGFAGLVPVSLAAGDLQLGQSVIVLGGESTNSVDVGRVASFTYRETEVGTTTVKAISGIVTDTSSENVVSGSLLFNLSGNLVGVRTSGSLQTFTPVANFKRDFTILAQ